MPTIQITREAVEERLAFFREYMPGNLFASVNAMVQRYLAQGNIERAHSILSMCASARTAPAPKAKNELHGLDRVVAALASANPRRPYSGPKPQATGLARVTSAFERQTCRQ